MAKCRIRFSGDKGRPSVLEKFFFGIFWPGIFVIVGAACFWLSLHAILTASASKNWPSVQGVVTHSDVQSRWSSSPVGTPQHRSGPTRLYLADVQYTYAVDGVEYTGDRVEFGDYSSSNALRASKIAKTYRVGSDVTVYYDPSRPSRAVLVPGKATLFAKAGVAIGAVFLLIGILFGLFIWASFRQRTRRALQSPATERVSG